MTRGHAPVTTLPLLGVLTAFGFAVAAALGVDPRSAADAQRDATAGRTLAADAGAKRRAQAAFERLPLSFSPNAGQTDRRVRYLARGTGSSLFFTGSKVVLSLVGPAASAARPGRGLALELRFVGANRDTTIEAGDRAPGISNHLVGDRSEWRRGLPSYRELTYRDLWPGIDLVFRGRGGSLKHEFHVAPGADVRAIRLSYAGADDLGIGSDGRLLAETALGTLTDARPVSHQVLGGRRVPVESRYALSGAPADSYGFAVGAGYDRGNPLVIDPGLDYSTFLGGAAPEQGEGIAIDGTGSAYVTGITVSAEYPTTPGAFDPGLDGFDAFVTKLDPSGSTLVYSTFLGGSDQDLAWDLALDKAGSAYVTGDTRSMDFPTTRGSFSTHNGDSDVFVTSWTPPARRSHTRSCSADRARSRSRRRRHPGRRPRHPRTSSGGHPVTSSAVDQTFNGGDFDAFVTKLDGSGSTLAYSTFLGGPEDRPRR